MGQQLFQNGVLSNQNFVTIKNNCAANFVLFPRTQKRSPSHVVRNENVQKPLQWREICLVKNRKVLNGREVNTRFVCELFPSIGFH